MPGTLVSAEMAAAVGREVRRSVSFPIDPSDIRRWAVAIYYPEPPPAYFWDERAAAATVHRGIVAPEDFNPFAWMTAAGPVARPTAGGSAGPGEEGGGHDPDVTERQLGVRPPGLRHQLNGGLEIEYGVRMRAGDVVRSVVRLAGYSERAGRLGPMLLTVLEDSWTNQRDEPVRRARTTIIRY
jgi:N-terminal half of MaoC dehydratase